MRFENIAPASIELRVVDDLIFLQSGTQVGAVATPLEMHDRRGRLNYDAITRFPNAEAQVGILVISRFVQGVEAPEFAEQQGTHHQRSAAHIIGVAQIAVIRVLRVLLAPPVPTTAVAPNDAAAFLQFALAEQQARARDADGRILERVAQGIEPFVLNQRVVVEKIDELAACRFRAGVARADEAQVLLVPDNLHADG